MLQLIWSVTNIFHLSIKHSLDDEIVKLINKFIALQQDNFHYVYEVLPSVIS